MLSQKSFWKNPLTSTNMISLEDLRQQTAHFLDLHWPEGEPRPAWSEPWEFVGTIPNHEMQGCYALLRGQEVIYIGVGAGNGPARYRGAGLGSRLHRYWQRHPEEPRTPDGESRYAPVQDWGEATAIVTIGFAPERGYLAYALEPYLIGKLKPERNTIGK